MQHVSAQIRSSSGNTIQIPRENEMLQNFVIKFIAFNFLEVLFVVVPDDSLV